ncbi:MAG: D-alanine--D-alanine ligase A [Bdellovibrionales bacterium GWB1_55_8]|nr:MAG: D-alanine--D-alanine ligase A [Bdellovibrionales bacterium GWB1_55_8]
MKKLRVMVLYGGRSGEHEVSLRSGASVMRQLDREKFDILPVAIDKQGRWLLSEISSFGSLDSALSIPADATPVTLRTYPAKDGRGELIELQADSSGSLKTIPFDVAFPVMHGPLCEDGTLQGLLELAEVAYVGCGVLASSVGMDKEVAKRLARDAGIPMVPYISVKSGKQDWSVLASRVGRELGYPAFVKPANMGSSVGVHRVRSESELRPALEDAFRYDTKVLIERSVSAREIELSVLENREFGGAPRVSVPGEIIPRHEFYSYEAKYLDDNGAALLIPAKLDPSQVKLAQDMALKAFSALECEGMARCDLFLDKNTGEFFFNEVNTIPGFTSISMYPKMWEASGISYPALLTELVELAVARQKRKRALLHEFGR